MISLYYELSRALAQVYRSIAYTAFNSLDEYEQDLVALGFPALMHHLFSADFAELHRQCLLFDLRLKEFLSGQSVELNAFATVEDLEMFLSL